MGRKQILFAVLFLATSTAAVSQSAPNPFDRFYAPVLGPWEKYGGRPSGVDLKPAIIPTLFRGEWNDPVSACGTGLSDMRLRIRANGLSYYESDGEVRRIIRHNGRAVTVLATYSGEGQVWDRVDRLVISRSGNQLTIQSGQSSATRYRCPAIKARK